MIESADAEDQLLRFLHRSRWFAGKGRSASLRSLTPLPWLRPPGDWPAVRIELAEIGYPDAASEYYQLPLAYRPDLPNEAAEVTKITIDDHGELVGYDAVEDPVACDMMLAMLVQGARFTDDDHEIEFEPEPGASEISPGLTARRFTGEQSNTSILYGQAVLLKLFRRLELGDNLDITTHRALNRAGTADAARLYGRMTARWPAGESGHRGAQGATLRADLGMLIEQFPDAQDGWRLAVEAAESGTDFTQSARRLGAALAGVHDALRATFPTGTREGDEIAAGMIDRLKRTGDFAPQLDEYADAIRARFNRLSGLTLDTQRVHGDFHLGQTLRTAGGWKIIDFEGEPAKTMSERLLPDSRWRDVAGMLRSFDYAVADSPEAAEQGWAEAAKDAFLAGYSREDQLTDTDRLIIDVYVADKAIYELGYEARNRPDWVHIPLAAIERLAQPDHQANEESDHG